MISKLLLAGAFIAAMSVTALADPIEGSWKTKSGETARISKCGSSFCIKLTTGDHAGKQIGKLKANGGKYSGSITDPQKDKTYSGDGKLSGNTLKMRGCVAYVLCRSENWSRL